MTAHTTALHRRQGRCSPGLYVLLVALGLVGSWALGHNLSAQPLPAPAQVAPLESPALQGSSTALLSGSASSWELTSHLDPWPQRNALRIDVTHWLSTDPSGGLGISMGWAQPTPSNRPTPLLLPDTLWEPTFGVHWRHTVARGMQLDISTWAQAPYGGQLVPGALDLVWQHDSARYGARLEVQWAAPRFGGLLPEYRAIGIRLEGHSQLLLRARSGGPMVYYRTKF